jgi:hypothetical protein
MTTTNPKRKPYLSGELAMLQEENAQLRRTKALLEEKITTVSKINEILEAELQFLRNGQQRQARQNGYHS